MSNNNLKFIDLFCGIGSFHYSFKKRGWECVMACDIDSAARETYFRNYGIKPLGDIAEIEPSNIPSYDILCAGFPCQPFSQCGKHKGFEDSRGTMFFQIMRLVFYHKPSVILLENVSGLVTHNSGQTLLKMVSELKKNGYTVVYKILKCSDYGIPQMRRRLFIIAVKEELPMSAKVGDILNLDEYRMETTLAEWFNRPFVKKIAYTIRCGGRRSALDDKHNWDGYIVGGSEYRLTLEDCLSLQGFEKFELFGTVQQRWKQVGNTIPTIFTELIGRNIDKYWN